MLDRPRDANRCTKTSSETDKLQFGLFPFVNLALPAMKSFGISNFAVRSSEEIAQGWLRFVGNRLRKDLALPQQLSACRTAQDIYLLYSEFWQQVARDYAAEFWAATDTAMAIVNAPRNTECCGCQN